MAAGTRLSSSSPLQQVVSKYIQMGFRLKEHAGHGVLILAPRTVGVAIADVLVVDAQKAAVRVGSGTGEAVDAVLRRGTSKHFIELTMATTGDLSNLIWQSLYNACFITNRLIKQFTASPQVEPPREIHPATGNDTSAMDKSGK
ncbi:hypothetical protein TYRP_016332 [Tyrophagus putrescentiae]|nr:hypothetical protein TYRP_016332 [Tyrophagus putrescentiae]